MSDWRKDEKYLYRWMLDDVQLSKNLVKVARIPDEIRRKRLIDAVDWYLGKPTRYEVYSDSGEIFVPPTA